MEQDCEDQIVNFHSHSVCSQSDSISCHRQIKQLTNDEKRNLADR